MTDHLTALDAAFLERAGELMGLRWPDIGTDTIRVERPRRHEGSYAPPKNGKARTIAFLPPARVLDEVPRRPDDDFVFHAPRGGALDKGSLFYSWCEVRAEAGLRRVRWHDLRHFCATQLLEMGFSHFDMSVQLGHEDGGNQVMERYGHPSKDTARIRLLQGFELDTAETGSWAGSRGAGEGGRQAW